MRFFSLSLLGSKVTKIIFISSIFKKNNNYLGINKFRIISQYSKKNIIALGYEKISISSFALEDIEIIEKISNEIGSQSVVVTFDYKKNGLMNI